jgi:hypothetical protein
MDNAQLFGYQFTSDRAFLQRLCGVAQLRGCAGYAGGAPDGSLARLHSPEQLH